MTSSTASSVTSACSSAADGGRWSSSASFSAGRTFPRRGCGNGGGGGGFGNVGAGQPGRRRVGDLKQRGAAATQASAIASPRRSHSRSYSDLRGDDDDLLSPPPPPPPPPSLDLDHPRRGGALLTAPGCRTLDRHRSTVAPAGDVTTPRACVVDWRQTAAGYPVYDV